MSFRADGGGTCMAAANQHQAIARAPHADAVTVFERGTKGIIVAIRSAGGHTRMARDNEMQDDEVEGVDTMDADDGDVDAGDDLDGDEAGMTGGSAGGRGSSGGSRKGARGSQRSAGGARKA